MKTKPPKSNKNRKEKAESKSKHSHTKRLHTAKEKKKSQTQKDKTASTVDPKKQKSKKQKETNDPKNDKHQKLQTLQNIQESLSINFLSILITIALIAGTFIVYYISKGYRLNINNGEIEKTGVINISSSPRRAEIYIDNSYAGNSPKAIAGIEKGKHRVKIQKEDYYTWEGDVKVIPEQSIPVFAKLFLKKPQKKVIFASNNLEIEQFKFDQNNQNVFFTNYTNEEDVLGTQNEQNTDDNTNTPTDLSEESSSHDSDYPNTANLNDKTPTNANGDSGYSPNNDNSTTSNNTTNNEPTDKNHILEIWHYSINHQFWQTNPEPSKIVTFDHTQPQFNDINIFEVDLTPSPNGNKILLTFTQKPNTNHNGNNNTENNPSTNQKNYFLINTNSDNPQPQELTTLSRYEDINPRWAQDSKHLIFTKDQELRSFNIETQTQVILFEHDQYKYNWTSHSDSTMYIAKELEDTFSIHRITVNGEKKEEIIENIIKITETTSEPADTSNPKTDNTTLASTEPNLTQSSEESGETGSSTNNTPTSDNTGENNTGDKLLKCRTINDIQILGQNEYLLIMTPKSMFIHFLTAQEKAITIVQANQPKFLLYSPQSKKLLYSTNDNQIMEYLLEVKEGDPIHTVGKKEIIKTQNLAKYTNFQWLDDEGYYISYAAKENKNAPINIKVLHTESNQTFQIIDNLESTYFAPNNTFEKIITTCEDKKLCEFTLQ